MDITLNQTPIRTSKNYQINDITLKNVQIPNSFELTKTKISYSKSSNKDFILEMEKDEKERR